MTAVASSELAIMRRLHAPAALDEEACLRSRSLFGPLDVGLIGHLDVPLDLRVADAMVLREVRCAVPIAARQA